MDGLVRPPFGTTLRHHRLAAGLTQEALAERAGLSVRGIQGLEAGARRPNPDTMERLIRALGLAGDERAGFETAGHRRPAVSANDRAKAPETLRHNLPLPLNSFIGRDRERAEVAHLISRDPAGPLLVTLTGPGGTGKTRLALEVAAALLDGDLDGIWLVELASLLEPALVLQAVAAAVGVRDQPGRPLQTALLDALRPKGLLLILDNCEHLLDACAEVADAVLRACPRIRVLATSREGLGVVGERIYPVPSLIVPTDRDVSSLTQLARCEAIQLFVDRAASAHPRFALTDSNAAAVAQICRRLDGIPLALELAAARMRVLSAEELAHRLAQRFAILTNGGRTAPPRHRTLRAAIDWSYALLGETERALLARLSAFASSWTLEAADAVCVGDGIAQVDVLPLLANLVEKSFLVVDEQGGASRYRLLETIRDYARERLDASGDAERVRTRHAAYYADLADRAASHLTAADRDDWLDVLKADDDNLRAALAWSFSNRGGPETGVRLGASLWWFWYFRGNWGEGRGWLEEALARGSPVDSVARARATDGAGMLAYLHRDLSSARSVLEQGVSVWRRLDVATGLGYALTYLSIVLRDLKDLPAALAVCEESVRLLRPLGDAWGLALALVCFGNVARDLGDDDRALASYQESLLLWRETGDQWGLGLCLGDLATVAHRRGDLATARALAEQSLSIRRTAGDRFLIDSELARTGAVARSQRDHDRAVALFEEKLVLDREISYGAGIAWSLQNLGYVAIERGDLRQAAALLREGLLLHAQGRHPLGVALCFGGLARIAAAEGASATAARLLGRAAGYVDALGDSSSIAPTERADLITNFALAERLMRDSTSARAFADGRAREPEEGITLASEEGVGASSPF